MVSVTRLEIPRFFFLSHSLSLSLLLVLSLSCAPLVKMKLTNIPELGGNGNLWTLTQIVDWLPLGEKKTLGTLFWKMRRYDAMIGKNRPREIHGAVPVVGSNCWRKKNKRRKFLGRWSIHGKYSGSPHKNVSRNYHI